MSVMTALRGHDLFRSLPLEEVEKVSRISSVKEFAENDWICQHGASATHVFLLLKGKVHLLVPSSAGHREHSMLIAKVEPGYFIGLSALVGEEHYTASALCPVPSTVLVIEAVPFRQILLSNHPVGFEVMSAVAKGYSARYHEVLKRLQAIVSQIPLMG